MPPAKHVRFQEPIEGSPVMSTPSPTYSSASLESNSPLTPPQMHLPSPGIYLSPQLPPLPHNFSGSPIIFASPQLGPPPVRIHPLLSPGPQPFPLAWDLRQPIGTASAFALPARRYELLEPYQLEVPATEPPLSSITIVSEYLPWPVVITPRASANSSPRKHWGVTVGDVIHGLYRNLRTTVHPVELASLGDAQTRATDACLRRCGGNQTELQRGVKRIDFLFEAHAFAGLHMVIGAPLSGKAPGEVWALNLAVLQ